MELIFEPREGIFREIETFINRVRYPNLSEQRQVDRAMRRAFAKSFSNQGGAGSWAALKESTANDRRLLGYRPYNPILIRRGVYMRSFTLPGGDHVFRAMRNADEVLFESGSQEERVRWLEYGTRFMPPRPVADISAQSESEIISAYDDMIDNVFRHVFGV